MSFESVMTACGKLIDNIIAWHINLPWYYQMALYMTYFVFIGFWVMKRIPHIPDVP